MEIETTTYDDGVNRARLWFREEQPKEIVRVWQGKSAADFRWAAATVRVIDSGMNYMSASDARRYAEAIREAAEVAALWTEERAGKTDAEIREASDG